MTHIGVRKQSMMFFHFLPAGSARRAALLVLFLLTCGFLFFAPQGQHVAPIKLKFPLLAAKFHLDRSRGGGLRPQKLKKWNFTKIIAPKGRVPCTILTKFTGYVRVLSLHKFAKFGCFISINDKIINNLPLCGRFQPNFRLTLPVT